MKKIIFAAAAISMLSAAATAQDIKRSNRKYRKHKPVYYYNGNVTGRVQTDSTRPSPYKGDKVPENDGVKKNMNRNMNYNSGQPLPSNSGK